MGGYLSASNSVIMRIEWTKSSTGLCLWQQMLKRVEVCRSDFFGFLFYNATESKADVINWNKNPEGNTPTNSLCVKQLQKALHVSKVALWRDAEVNWEAWAILQILCLFCCCHYEQRKHMASVAQQKGGNYEQGKVGIHSILHLVCFRNRACPL